jgi:hypothetical protein
MALLAAFYAVGPAAAHHPPFMERCQSFTFTGRIERIDWRNPHVELTIRTDGGESHEVTWLNLQALARAGIARDTLRVGDEVTVTVGTRDDIVPRPMLLAAITRTRDDWEWSQVPQGC